MPTPATFTSSRRITSFGAEEIREMLHLDGDPLAIYQVNGTVTVVLASESRERARG